MTRFAVIVLLVFVWGCESTEPAGVWHADGHATSSRYDAYTVSGYNGIDSRQTPLDSLEPDDVIGCNALSWQLGEELLFDVTTRDFLSACDSAEHVLVLSHGQTVSLEIDGNLTGLTAQVVNRFGMVVSEQLLADSLMTLDFTADYSGPYWLRLGRTTAFTEPVGYQLTPRCLSACDKLATRYPVVLVHGMLGSDDYFGIRDYFYNIKGDLISAGYEIYTPVTDPVAPSVTRAEQLAAQVDDILAKTGATKLHFIAHSQGGIDIRILSDGLNYAPIFASATTISTPHHGINIWGVELLNKLPLVPGHDFSVTAAEQFDLDYPAKGNYGRFSWAGKTCGLLAFKCQRENHGEIVSPVFALSEPIIRFAHRNDGHQGDNDGLVPVSSAMWGDFLGVIAADHMDEVNQLLNLTPIGVDIIQFYRDEFARLRQLEMD